MSEQGLSNDELSAWNRTRFTDWDSFWNKGVKFGDMHPAFYQVFLWFWVRLFGDSEFSLRSTGLLFFILNSYLIYRISCRHFTKLSGLLVLSLYVGLTFTIMNTVFARPYNSGLFFILLAFWAVLELKERDDQKSKWTIILSIGFFGAMVSHYFAFLVAFVLGLSALFYLGKKGLKNIFLAGFLSVIAFLPHLSITLFQTGRGGLGWLPAPTIMWPIDFIHVFFNESWVLFFILVLIFGAALFFFKIKKLTNKSIFSLSFFISSFVLAFIMSHLFTPILRDQVMLFLLPFFLIPLFSLLLIDSNKWSFVLIGAVTFIPLFDSFFLNQLLEPVHFGIFKEIGDEINEANEKYGKENITFASNFNNVDYINYYVEKDLSEDISNWEDQSSLYTLASRAKNSKTPYFCYSFSNNYHTPMFLELIRQYYPAKVKVMFTKFSSFYLFEKKKNRDLNAPFLTRKISDTSSTTNEFFNEVTIDVSELPKIKNKNSYYLLKTNGQIQDSSSFYIVIGGERDGKLIMNGKYPLLYLAYDHSKINKLKTNEEFFVAFDLPEKMVPTDRLKIYCWNPNHNTVKTSDFRFYLIEGNQ